MNYYHYCGLYAASHDDTYLEFLKVFLYDVYMKILDGYLRPDVVKCNKCQKTMYLLKVHRQYWCNWAAQGVYACRNCLVRIWICESIGTKRLAEIAEHMEQGQPKRVTIRIKIEDIQ